MVEKCAPGCRCANWECSGLNKTQCLRLERERLDRYESGLTRLPADQREAVILRLEMDYSHAEIAAALGRPSADAARMLVARALVALAEAMRDDD